MIFFIFFVFGLIVGSFLNAVIYRLWDGKSISTGRSECPHCGHVLSAADLVPVLSFIWLRGTCRYCDKKISWQYPLVELVTAITFALLAWKLDAGIANSELWFSLIYACFFIVIAIFDLKHYLILDKVVFSGIAVVLIQIIFVSVSDRLALISLSSPLIQGLLGAVIIAGFFGIQYLVSSGRWIGLGDVKLGLFLGLIFGVGQSLMLLLLGYLSGAIVGVALVGLSKKEFTGKLPFGTFLAFCGIIMLLYGTSLIHWYLGLLGF